ncbi:MAG: hypothetical protein AAGJ46_00805 [Planctomycetota bacterium]
MTAAKANTGRGGESGPPIMAHPAIKTHQSDSNRDTNANDPKKATPTTAAMLHLQPPAEGGSGAAIGDW